MPRSQAVEASATPHVFVFFAQKVGLELQRTSATNGRIRFRDCTLVLHWDWEDVFCDLGLNLFQFPATKIFFTTVQSLAVRTHAVNFGWPDCRFRICGHQCFPEKLLGRRFCGGESIPCDQECGGKTTRFVAATSKFWECCLQFAPLTNYDWIIILHLISTVSKRFIYLVVMSYVAGMSLFTALTAISWKMCEREGKQEMIQSEIRTI